MPAKFESGNHNVAGIVGLGAGCQFLLDRGIAQIHSAISRLVEELRGSLAGIDGVTLYGPTDAAQRVGVVSINVRGYDPQEVASALDAHYHVQVRAGLHCAAHIHDALKTAGLGGTVRFSLGVFNTAGDISAAVGAVSEIAATM
jgi:selenocysteine lyase/cysteine desulfurase